MRSIGVIPTYNCETVICELVRHTAPHVDSILVIDDGSTDKTAIEAERGGAAVIRLPENRGKEAALLSGFRTALTQGFDTIVTIDGDGENDPNDIPYLVSRLVIKDADAALGCRTMTHSSGILGFKLTKALLKRYFSLNIDDAMCGLRAYRSCAIASILPQVRSEGFGIDLELALLLILNRASLTEVPVSGSGIVLHDGLKATHVYAFLRNLEAYAPRFNPNIGFDLQRVLRDVQENCDFDFTIGDTVKRFRYNPTIGLYE